MNVLSGASRAAGIAIVAAYVLGSIFVVWVLVASGAWRWDISRGAITFAGAGFALIGALLVARQPRNPIGWLLASFAFMAGVFPTFDAYAIWQLRQDPTPGLLVRLLVWPNGWYWYLFIGLMFCILPLIYPTGRLVSRRWRVVAVPAIVLIVFMTIMGSVAEKISTQEVRIWIDNPLGIRGVPSPESVSFAGVLFILFGIVELGALASLVVRFVRSRDEERLQLKWFLFAVAVLFVSVLVPDGSLFDDAVFAAGIMGIPAGIGIALLRYRLYEIDRVISRTLSYALITAALVAVYLGLVVALGSILRPWTGGEDLAIAVSTLGAAAAFRPVRRRVQALVDRRFNRSRYDAQQTIEAFAGRLRDQVDIDSLTADLRQVVSETMHPVMMRLWTKPTGGSR